MDFYVCINTKGCTGPNIGRNSGYPKLPSFTPSWFSGLIYTHKNHNLFWSIAQKNDYVWGGYIRDHQVKKLKIKRVL